MIANRRKGQKTHHTGCEKNTSEEMAHQLMGILRLSDLVQLLHGMRNLATQTTLTSRNRDCRAELCSGNLSHVSSYEP